MIFIYKELVRKYINRLTPNDLEKFAQSNNITYTEDELQVVYHFIKEHYNDLLDENIKVCEEIRYKISPTLYKQLLTLYIDYKQKYL